MKKILYIGNNLSNKKSNPSSIQVLGALLEKEGFRLQYASSKNNKVLRLLDMVWACVHKARTIDFVLIDTYSTFNFYYAFVVSQICRVLQLKYIPVLHGGNLPVRLKKSPYLSGCIFKYAYKNVSPSLYLIAAFKKHGYSAVRYIPNSIEISKYPFKSRKLDSLDLLWVRSFSTIYNPGLAIKVLHKLQKQGLKASLCMVGPDSDGTMQEVKELANTLEVEVTFTGKLTKEAWIALSKGYNIFINTTNFDNMPVSVIEAMALGLPVVSTNVGGMPFLIENNKEGLLVEKENVDAFVKAIKELVQHPDKTQTRALKARKKVESFSWHLIKKQWVEVLC
ncbi:glycosyltransferase family 4 protein [Lacinutrix sp. C3R15]|uniref:glycosyltransferase family 4 protein n=1 Tax=Flavobacteriaceae TaxID=49546 RepID=UPI001C09B5F1|nr:MULTISPECIES: glycosyltransferase family 4 protein [Flavobacteriaceae]MBU2939591.1 glycosyltransferase family 4 protein [Lacinutrix sp. C3R15]MDO6622905.1 glycosyltransferase family 4 protein [Oceanihabitans sp. 1_MG-2023]